MWMIKKWQDDAIGALIVAGSAAYFLEGQNRLLYLAGSAAVYWVDGCLRDFASKKIAVLRTRRSELMQTNGPLVLTAKGKELKESDKIDLLVNQEQLRANYAAMKGWGIIANNVSILLRLSTTFFMLEKPVRSFVASCGYGDGVAKVALESVSASLMNLQGYSKNNAYTGEYDGNTGVLNSKLVFVLRECLIGLLANSFEDGVGKYPKAWLSTLVVYGAMNCLTMYSTGQQFNKDTMTSCGKSSLLGSVSYVAGMEVGQRCNFDNLAFESIAQSLASNIALSVGSMVI